MDMVSLLLLTVPRKYPRLDPVLCHAVLPDPLPVAFVFFARIGYKSDVDPGMPVPTLVMGKVSVTLVTVFDCNDAKVDASNIQ